MTFSTRNPLKPTKTHDVDAYLDYTWGLSDLIPEGDSVASAIFITPVGATLDQTSVTQTSAVGWLRITDPTLLNSTISITCRFTTAQGRIDDRTLYFKIVEK